MSRYGTSIETVGKNLQTLYPAGKDPSQDAMVFLALAFAAVKRLEEMGADLEFKGRPLALPGIERAYRELLHIRVRLPVSWLDDTIISRFGRLNANNLPSAVERAINRNPDDLHESRAGDDGASTAPGAST